MNSEVKQWVYLQAENIRKFPTQQKKLPIKLSKNISL